MKIKKTIIQYPWLSSLTSLIAPLFGIVNSVDIFYGGLPLELALAFVASLFSSFILLFVFNKMVRRRDCLRQLQIVFLVFLLSTSFSILLVSVAPSGSRFLVPPYRSSVYEGISTYNSSVISFAFIGYFIGLLAAFGLKQWLKVLVDKNINHWFKRMIAVMSTLFILGASISSLLQFSNLTFFLVIISVTLPLLAMVKR